MITDLEFTAAADRFMEEVLDSLSELDPDLVDCQLAMGVLTMEFSGGTKAIMNRQTAAHQIWLAHGATAWHFSLDPESKQWLDTKGRGELKQILAQELSDKLGQPICLTGKKS